MSSSYVRTQILNLLSAEAPTENVIDLSGQYAEIADMIADASLTSNDPWLGVQFIGDDEIPISIGSTNTEGKYRETGSIYMHVVDIAALGSSGNILTRGENLRNTLRGRRLDNLVIESVTPLNFDLGATIQFEGGYMSASFFVTYINDLDL